MFGFNELSTPVKAIIALALVLVLVVIAGLILRRIAGGRLKFKGNGGRTRQPRIGIVDIFDMDRQRQLVLLRRDNVEHLVMIGGPNDLVIEASIIRSGSRAQLPVVPEMPDATQASEGEAASQGLVAQRRAPQPAAAPPSRPAGAPAEQPPLPMQPPARTPRVEAPAEPAAPLPSFLSRHAGAVAAAAAAGTAVVATAREAAVPQPAATPPGPPPLAKPVMVEAPTKPVHAPAAPADALKAESMPVAITPEPVPAIASPPPEPKAPTPLIVASASDLDDMTRQLEEALKRPFAAAKPAPAQPQPAPKPEPIAAAAVDEPAVPVQPPAMDFSDALNNALMAELNPEPVAPAQAPEPAPVAKVPAPEPKRASEPPPAPHAPKTAAPATAAPAKDDPFSVDAIEAEFARLLNRNGPAKN
ncbi:MAG: hypothetical protein NTZ14_18470 [Hyphomicrobiales bacterium]|nr:hypothetical protein [Hyphomicrobiales bacterium]